MKTDFHESPRESAPARSRCATDLAEWARHSWQNGLQIERLWPGDQLVISTANSTYEITVISPAGHDIIVRGGRFFPEPARVRLDGCSLGGAFLKIGGIYVGFALELRSGEGVIVTSRVLSVGFVQHG